MSDETKKDGRKYYLGLDIGTDSVGFAVTDEHYQIIRKQGKHLWGSRLFDKASTAKERRGHRTARRRYVRRRQRILWLQEIFTPAMKQVDPNFFDRLNNSAFLLEDKDEAVRSDYEGMDIHPLLFPFPQKDADVTFSNDAAYHNKFPTIYHLRKAMEEQPEKKFDLRLVYLVLAHMVKYRGNFLMEGEMKQVKADPSILLQSLEELSQAIEAYNSASNEDEVDENDQEVTLPPFSYDLTKAKTLSGYFQDPRMRLSDLEEQGAACLGIAKKSDGSINVMKLFNAICGSTPKMKDVFGLDDREDDPNLAKPVDFSNEEFVDRIEDLSTFSDVLLAAKKIYDYRLMARTLQGKKSLSDAMVKRYNDHKKQLKQLKKIFKDYDAANGTSCFKEFFADPAAKGDNYLKYVGFYRDEEHRIHRYPHGTKKLDDLLKAIRDSAPIVNGSDNPDVQKILREIDTKNYLLLQNSKDNGSLPYQLNLNEMREILSNQKSYYPFLGEKAPEFKNPEKTDYKICSILEYRIPYFVGPLTPKKENDKDTENHWVVRKSDERITPWNFHRVVDEDASAQGFMDNLKNSCTYLIGEPTLPKDSLIYTKYVALNQMNGWRLLFNGKKRRLTFDEREGLFNKVFLKPGKVTTKKVQNYLVQFLNCKPSEITLCTESHDTLDDRDITLSLKPWLDMMDERAFGKDLPQNKKDIEKAEKVIQCQAVFENKELAKKRIDKIDGLTPEQKAYLGNLSYKGWGNLSKKLLDGLKVDVPDPATGEILPKSILDLMWETGKTFQEIYAVNGPDDEGLDTTGFKKQVDELTGEKKFTPYELIDEQWGSPQMKRSLRQSYRIIDELKKILKIDSFDAVFVEVTRTSRDDKKNQRTTSRKDQLNAFYKKVMSQYKELKDEIGKLSEKLNGIQDEGMLRRKPVFLYFAQLGRSVYSGEPIDFENLDKNYDVDHIIPQAKYKDDSFNNTVLVEQGLNRKKSDEYPIPDGVLSAKGREWIKTLARISVDTKIPYMPKEKANRLLRRDPLSEEELAGFVNRQIVMTSQATAGIANLLKWTDPNTRVVFSRADRVSDFRKEFDMLKCREVNDCHHAQDAYLNIVVGNVYDEVFTRSFTVKTLREKKKETDSIRMDVHNMFTHDQYRFGSHKSVMVWEAKDYSKDGMENPMSKGTLYTVRKYMAHNDVMVTKMLTTQVGKQGFFNKISILGKEDGNGLMPLKAKGPYAREDFAKVYGGYNDLTAPYFMLVESKGKKGKDVFTLENIPAVYLAQINTVKDEGERKAKIDDYLVKNGLVDPEVLLPKLLIGTIVERTGENGKTRLLIAGKTGNSIVCRGMMPLSLPKHWYDYFQLIGKFLGLNDSLDKKKGPSDADKIKDEVQIRRGAIISKEKNKELFDYLGSCVLTKPVYALMPASAPVRKDVQSENAKQAFATLNIVDQCNVLENILKYCGSGSETSDLTLIGGSGREGYKTINKAVNPSTDRIIAQSVTGFYETQLWPKKQ